MSPYQLLKSFQSLSSKYCCQLIFVGLGQLFGIPFIEPRPIAIVVIIARGSIGLGPFTALNLSGLGPFGFEQIITVAWLPAAEPVGWLTSRGIFVVESLSPAFRHPFVDLAVRC